MAKVCAMLLLASSTTIGEVHAQQHFEATLPSNFEETLSDAVAPLLDTLEPYKVYSGTHERGVPALHTAIGKLSLQPSSLLDVDCAVHTSDPQCQDETMAGSPMVGAGHHVRAQTNTPVIGILMQPIPSEDHEDSPLWREEFERVKQAMWNQMKKGDPDLKLEDVFPSN